MPQEAPQGPQEPQEGGTKAPMTPVDLFAALDGLLQLENRQPVVASPSEVTMAERMALRILCRHYGWTVIEPGTIRRPR